MKKYRLKDEKYRKLAQEIANFAVGGDLPLEDFVSMDGSAMRTRLEEYGVFDIWFEEVHPEFKSGDYIYIIHTGNIYEIQDCEVIEDELHWNTVGMDRGYKYKYRFCTYLSNLRPATAEEIEEYNNRQFNLPSINGYKGRQDGEYIVYGCKSIHIQDFRKLYEACMYADVSSVIIEGHQIQMETLQEIYNKTY